MSSDTVNIRDFIAWLRENGAAEVHIGDLHVRFKESSSMMPASAVQEALKDFENEQENSSKYDPMYYMSS